jgi:cell division protein FtsZ
MISYSRDPHSVIPAATVKIVGLGGAGANMLERLALDGGDPSSLLVLNTDIRTLEASLAQEKIQLGCNLTKGLGTGGDPDLGQQAVLEAEAAIRAQLRGCRIVFLCAGLGGGTGSGASPIVTRIAREEGAFVVVFATMPFSFEGRRRRDQAEASLNQLAVLSNALVTFDNNRMGELVLAKQGIHEAFAAADHMIGESIKAVIRLVTRPGLIHVGLDDLMSALRTTRSRCLFGSGIAEGKDRAAKALENALASPLLDQGALLKETRTVLVHLCGGESLTLYEVELLMQHLQKHIPAEAQVLFGAAVDSTMNDSLSITLISSLPEDSLAKAKREEAKPAPTLAENMLDPEQGFTPVTPPPAPPAAAAPPVPKAPGKSISDLLVSSPPSLPTESTGPDLFGSSNAPFFAEPDTEPEPQQPEPEPAPRPVSIAEFLAPSPEENPPAIPEPAPASPSLEPDDDFLTVPSTVLARTPEPEPEPAPEPAAAPASPEEPPSTPEPAPPSADAPKLKLGIKAAPPSSELGFDSAPRGRFEGESPNVFDGEDLDLPPFLRKKK